MTERLENEHEETKAFHFESFLFVLLEAFSCVETDTIAITKLCNAERGKGAALAFCHSKMT